MPGAARAATHEVRDGVVDLGDLYSAVEVAVLPPFTVTTSRSGPSGPARWRPQADAQEAGSAIRTRLAELYSGDIADGIRVLYGGSVKSGNVAAIMAQTDVDGALVGGGWIVLDEFVAICRYRDHVTAG